LVTAVLNTDAERVLCSGQAYRASRMFGVLGKTL
jgi:hypothetical protein